MAAGPVLVRVDRAKGPSGWGGMARDGLSWGGGGLAWVRDRGEHYPAEAPVAGKYHCLDRWFLAIYILDILVPILLSISVAIPFSFRPLWLSFLASLRDPFSVVRLFQP
jgi:hypothetical protein